MVVSFLTTPFVGYKNVDKGDGGISTGQKWLWVELGFVLLVRAISAVGCLTSALLLVSLPTRSGKFVCANVAT